MVYADVLQIIVESRTVEWTPCLPMVTKLERQMAVSHVTRPPFSLCSTACEGLGNRGFCSKDPDPVQVDQCPCPAVWGSPQRFPKDVLWGTDPAC